jgi:outer membrane protein assembly factor BamB
MNLIPTTLITFAFLHMAAFAEAPWGQWRGPAANGTSPDATPPTRWSETENVAWKTKIPGSGTSSPVVWGDRIFLTSAIPTGKKVEPPTPATPAAPEPEPPGREGRRRMRGVAPTEIMQFSVLCLNRKDGAIVWQKSATEVLPHEGHHGDHGFASHSAATDGVHVFVSFGSRGLHCYTVAGEHVWSKELGQMQTRAGFGEGASPLLIGDTIVVPWDHEGEDWIAAFATKDGREIWRQKRDEPTAWSTPLAVTHEGKTQVIANATNRIRSYDLATGQQIWECGGMTTNVVPSPIFGHGMVYCLSGFRGNAIRAIKLGHTGDLTDGPHLAWRYDEKAPYVPSGLLSGERLYFFSQNNGMLSCLDAKTGKVLLNAERVPELTGVYASPVAAAGRVYLLGRNGECVVIKDSTPLEVIATNRVDGKSDASLALVGPDLFLRTHEALYCLREK